MNQTVVQGHNIQIKAERLASAVFLVTQYMSDKESIKLRIREIVLNIVTEAAVLRNSNYAEAHGQLSVIQRLASELVSFLSIAETAGFISVMNSKVLQQEFQNFIAHLSIQAVDTLSQSVSLPQDFFHNETRPFIKDENIKNENKGHVTHFALPGSELFQKKEKLNRKEQRNKTILDLLSKNKEISIKDISASIKGCSEKTVQRELNVLIGLGLVKKSGERRWSRYSLA